MNITSNSSTSAANINSKNTIQDDSIQQTSRRTRSKPIKLETDLIDNTKFGVSKASFARVVKDIVKEETNSNLRISSEAIVHLQHEAENYLTEHFKKVVLVASHANRQTIEPTDSQLVRHLEENPIR